MPRRLLARIAIVLGGLALLGYWWATLAALYAGHLFVGTNYWDAPIGTWTRLIALVALTPAWLWATWRYWNWHGHQVVKD
jgi:hypothetical protein